MTRESNAACFARAASLLLVGAVLAGQALPAAAQVSRTAPGGESWGMAITSCCTGIGVPVVG